MEEIRSQVEELLLRATDDAEAWGTLLHQHADRLCNMIDFRLDARLRGRVDAADVIQEAFLVATARRADFFGQSAQPLFLWLRWIVGNTLLDLHRHHLGTQMRDAAREVSSHRRARGASDDDTRESLIARLTAGGTGPATAAGRAEAKAWLGEALAQME